MACVLPEIVLIVLRKLQEQTRENDVIFRFIWELICPAALILKIPLPNPLGKRT